MERRNFIKSATLSAAAFSLGSNKIFGDISNTSPNKNHKFNLRYAPHFGMFKNNAGESLVDQLNYISEQGFTNHALSSASSP